MLVFVGCSAQDASTAMSNNAAAIEAVGDPVLREVLRARYEGPDFQPWSGWISFDCDHDFFVDPTPGHGRRFACRPDRHALHDDARARPRARLRRRCRRSRRSHGTNHFVGAAAEEVHGGPVPLAPDGGHLDSSLESDGRSTLMDTSRTVGSRTRPTSLDVAVMGDLGYERTPQP